MVAGKVDEPCRILSPREKDNEDFNILKLFISLIKLMSASYIHKMI